MTILLTEISVKDGFTKFYSKTMKPEVFETIVTFSQPQEKNILLPLTKWVLKLYEKNPRQTMNELQLLNIDGGINILQMFQRLKDLNILTNNSADIGRYSSIRELYTVVKMFDPSDLEGDNTERKKRLMRPEFIEARNDIDKLYEDNEWLVVSPKSYEASVYWGHGTSWCTAYKDQRTYYDNYSRQGRLYINIDKRDGSKFQFHFESDSFMDEYDHEIEKPIFENMEATSNLIDFYEEELTPTNFDKLSEAQNFYEFVERLNDRYFIARRTENTEVEYYNWEQEYNIIDSYNENTKTSYGFDEYDIDKSSKCVRLMSGEYENVFDYQNGYEIFNEWVTEIVISSDGNKIIGLIGDEKIYFVDKRIHSSEYDEYKIADVISNRHLYLVNEDEYESEYCNILDVKNGEFLFDGFYDSSESSYYKGSLKPILLLWDVNNGIKKYNLETSELNDINLDIEYQEVRFLNDYQFAVQFDSVKGDEKWLIYDVDSLQPRFNGAEFDYVICNYETSATPLVCYKGKWNIINFFKGKFAFPDLWFDDITPKSQLINNRPYFTASIGDKKYLITASGSIHEKPQKETIFTSPKEISRTDPEYITKENNMKLTTNDISYIINEAKRLISEISVKDAYVHYQNTIPEDVYKWWVVTIQGDNADNAQLDSDTKWILKRYEEEGESMFGKAEQIVNAINIFKRMRVRGMLPPGITLERCSSIDELIAFTNSVNHDEVFARTQKELDRDIKAAKNDIDVVYEDDEWFVLVPKSMEASIYWGSRTNWCTATKTIENNRFEDYNDSGKLYININKQTKKKYQFHFENLEFNNQENDDIESPVLGYIHASKGLTEFYRGLMSNNWPAYKRFFDPNFKILSDWQTGGYIDFRVIENGYKMNMIDRNFDLLYDEGFDDIVEYYSRYDICIVGIDEIYYVFSTKKKQIISDGYDEFDGFLPTAGQFNNDPTNFISIVKKNEMYNFVNGFGKELSPVWFNEVQEEWYDNDRCIAKKGGDTYIIDTNGKVTKQ